MSEALEQEAQETIARRSPLDELHRQLGARMFERDGWLLPADYGDAASEYDTVREGGAGLIDFASRGRIRVSGAEAVQFLNGLVTNDVKTLAEGAWMSVVFPNVQGRLLAAARVLHLSDGFLFDTEAGNAGRVFKTLERFTLAGDFRVADLTPELSTLSLQGARAAEVLGAALGTGLILPERGRVAKLEWNKQPVSLIRATHTGEDGFDLFIGAMHAASLADALLRAGARLVGFTALETLRIEAGLPRFGVDMDETNVVLETGLDEAVSYTKGCYVGQEIIARIHWRGHVAKRLTGLIIEGEDEVSPAAKIKSADGKEIGRLTSIAFSPRLKQWVALGYVKYDYLKHGTQVLLDAGENDGRRAVVSELPLVHGGWFAGTENAGSPG
jgi:folate-binding protein YgfZ